MAELIPPTTKMTEQHATNAVPPMTKVAEPQQMSPAVDIDTAMQRVLKRHISTGKAENIAKLRVQGQTKKLKYLDFVQVATEYVSVRLSTVCECVKDNSGPLKSDVQTVESKVRTVIGPVYDKFHNVPFDLLNFVDRKVDEMITEVDRHVPSLINQAFSQARAEDSEVHQAGVVDTARKIAKTMYTKYEEKVKEYHPKPAWSSLNRLPPFSLVCLLFQLMGNFLRRFKFLLNLLWRIKFLFNLLRKFPFLFKLGLPLVGWGSIARLHISLSTLAY